MKLDGKRSLHLNARTKSVNANWNFQGTSLSNCRAKSSKSQRGWWLVVTAAQLRRSCLSHDLPR
jgi:hypothetical protein